MDAESLADLVAQHAMANRPYMEFVRSAAMSVGLYVLEPGGVDLQSPHSEDEVYIVLSGRAQFTAGSNTRDVAAGDTIYVAARVAHRFHDIVERLEVIVVFAPPET